MRFEAKHSYFKKITQNNGNFIDLLFTLSLRHQKLQCCYNLDRFGYHSHTWDIGRGEAQCTLYGLPYLEFIFFNEILGEVVSSVVAPPELTNCSKEILRLLLLICDYVSLYTVSVKSTGLYQYP